MHLSPPGGLGSCPFQGGGSVVVYFLFIVTPIVGVCNCSMFCCTLLYVHSSIAIILMGKRELIALLNLSSWCRVMVKRLFLAMPRGCLQIVILVFAGILEIHAKYTGVLHKQFLDIKLPEHIVQSVQYQEDFLSDLTKKTNHTIATIYMNF